MADGVPASPGTEQAPDASVSAGAGLSGDRASGLGPGRVVLVGAGPGDVELLTCKAARLIGEADWLVHDALVQPEVLALARRARIIAVGKRAGNPSARQSSINQILLDCAQRGGLTVRLKGGDPLIFARAQEELDVLHAAGVPVEVVPGISSAQAAHAALAMLGPDYRWTTRFYTTGPIRNGVLQGDLVMQGGGDPHLVIEDLHALMADLRAQGLTTIRGNLVIDDSRFAVGPAYGSAFDGDASQAYNVRPWAALTNFKASKLVVDPKSKQLVLDPPLADVQLRYDVKVLRGRCRGGATRVSVADGATPAGRPQVAVNGTQVRACGPLQFYAAMLDHQQFVHGIFKAAWKNMGGQFLGRTRIEPGAAKRARPLYAWQSSLDLGEVVHQINKFSNNVMTRMLLLEMAAAKGQGALAPEVAGQWLHGWYRSQGMPMASLTMENGSGLSRQARISAGDMVVLLARAAQSPQARWFEQSLPVVGIDGTMKTRLRLDPVAGQAQIKTGTLQEVRAIAGYVTAASGRRYALSLMINGKYPAERALHAQDELLRWVYRHG